MLLRVYNSLPLAIPTILQDASPWFRLQRRNLILISNMKRENVSLKNIQGVPGGMCQTSGECSLF